MAGPRAPVAEPSDEALLLGLSHGDEAAAVAFVRRYQRRVYGLAVGMLGDPAAAEDVAQETLLRVWRHAAMYDPRRGAVSTWVLTITRNLAVDALRLRRSTPVEPDQLVALGLASGERAPEDRAVASHGASWLRPALTALAPEQRRALVLAAVFGHTASEVATEEGIPLGTAKTRIRAALGKLRAAMADEQLGADGA
jgi:RNA polymerase sigma-70 factor (ECF subfamily)